MTTISTNESISNIEMNEKHFVALKDLVGSPYAILAKQVRDLRLNVSIYNT